MKNIFALIIIFLVAVNIKAQDIIITHDGKKIEAKVIEVGVEVVKYKKYDYQEGVSYSIKKSDIASIMYEDGSFDVFSKEARKTYLDNSDEKRQKQKLALDLQKAQKLKNAGIGCTIGGLLILGGGLGCYLPMELYFNYYLKYGNAYGMYAGGITMMTVGSALTVSGIICIIVGQIRMNDINYLSIYETNKFKLDMALGMNNVGIRLKF